MQSPQTHTIGVEYASSWLLLRYKYLESSRHQASFLHPSLSPLYPITSPPPYHYASTQHPFFSISLYLWSAGAEVLVLSVWSRSAAGVVPQRRPAQWKLHKGRHSTPLSWCAVAVAPLLRAPAAVFTASTKVGGAKLS